MTTGIIQNTFRKYAFKPSFQIEDLEKELIEKIKAELKYNDLTPHSRTYYEFKKPLFRYILIGDNEK